MKNSKGFYTDSFQCKELGGSSAAYYVEQSKWLDFCSINIWNVCEWHHASNNRIAFFPKNEEERKACNEIKEDVEAFKESYKKSNLPKTKAALWRGLCTEDKGHGSIDYKIGKYGKFKCDYGTPDGRGYFPSEAYAKAAWILLNK